MAEKTLTEVCQYLQGKIGTLTGAPCYEFERFIVDEDGIRDLATRDDSQGDRRIEMWTVVADDGEAGPDTEEDRIDFTYDRRYNLVIRGILSHNDENASGITFRDQIEAIIDGIDDDAQLGGHANHTEPIDDRVRNELREFTGGHLVHYCELVLPVILRRSRTTT